ncbi:MAG: ABC transporter substrate-binding protein [Dermatophilaceae bacterium]
MSRRSSRLAGIATLCTIGLALTACSGTVAPKTGASSGPAETAVTGGTLNMLGTGDVTYLDPNISYYSIDQIVLRMFARALFTNPAAEGKTTIAAPDLATELPTAENGGISADGKTYTIKLVQGAKWDTTPARQITAADVVRGVKRTCNPVQPFGGIPDFQDLIVGYAPFCEAFGKVAPTAAAMGAFMEKTDLPGVQAKDDSTVTFALTHPAAFFLDMLTMPCFSPAPVEINKYIPGSADGATHTISSGPYKIDSYVATKSIKLSRNPAWDAKSDPIRKAYVDKIDINETLTQDSVQQQLETGTPSADMEFDSFTPASQIPALVAKGDKNLNIGPSSSSNPYVVFNTVSPNNNKALANVKVRQALSFAISRANLIQVMGGPQLNTPLSQVLPAVIIGGETPFDLYPYDVAKAKTLLTEAGFPNGFSVKFLYRPTSASSLKGFQTIQQDLSKVGVKVVGVPSPSADFYSKYLTVPSVAIRGVWDLSLAGWGADWYGNAALSFFNPLFSGKPSFPPVGSNFGLYDSPATNAAITAAVNAPTQDEAKTLWAAADKAVMTDAPFFPITNPKQPNYHASQVHNTIYVPSMQQFDPTNVWIDKDKQGG